MHPLGPVRLTGREALECSAPDTKMLLPSATPDGRLVPMKFNVPGKLKLAKNSKKNYIEKIGM